jgi:transcriptional regulator with XRE-family HTH domain
MTTIHDPRYLKLVEHLINIRKRQEITQVKLSTTLGVDQSFVSKVENLERRLDIIELYDWIGALEYSAEKFFGDVGWFAESGRAGYDTGLPAIPLRGAARQQGNDAILQLAWQGEIKEVVLNDASAKEYIALEKRICAIYADLDRDKPLRKNREAIFEALFAAISTFPKTNPSDLYHHVVYRLYLREYSKTQADRSWVRAGGEALELFIQQHYAPMLLPFGIRIKWLVGAADKASALKEMGIQGKVGGSKLDIALYGDLGGRTHLFGGIHAKASLAERVSDDVPCSEAMMAKGYVSYLVTLDAKSFPPPTGDLVNRGELGSNKVPSDKRKYIEEHGSFDACFSYNLRTSPSGPRTRSRKKIFVSSFDLTTDLLPTHIVQAWAEFQRSRISKKPS